MLESTLPYKIDKKNRSMTESVEMKSKIKSKLMILTYDDYIRKTLIIWKWILQTIAPVQSKLKAKERE